MDNTTIFQRYFYSNIELGTNLHVVLNEVTGRTELVNYVSSKYLPGGLALESGLRVGKRRVQRVPFGFAVDDGAGCRSGHAVVPTLLLLLIRGSIAAAGGQRAREPSVHVVPERFLQ